MTAICGATSAYGSHLPPKCGGPALAGRELAAVRRLEAAQQFVAAAYGVVKRLFRGYLSAPTLSSSSSTTVRICGMFPKRRPRVKGSGGLFSICSMATSLPGCWV